MAQYTLRLRTSLRYPVYAAFAVLFLTGAGWLVADWQKNISDNDIWQQAVSYMLMVHGGAAMVTLVLLGYLIPVHLLRGWRSGRNLGSGSIMVTFNAVLMMTAFGLYYLGSESVRPWVSWIHLTAGILVSLLFPIHILLGRREAP